MRKACRHFMQLIVQRYLQGTCFPYLCKGKIKAAGSWRVLGKTVMTPVRQRQPPAGSRHGCAGTILMKSGQCTENDRSGIWGFRRQKRQVQTQHGAADLTCKACEGAVNRIYGYGTGSIRGHGRDVSSGNVRVVTLCSIYNEARNALQPFRGIPHETDTGHRHHDDSLPL